MGAADAFTGELIDAEQFFAPAPTDLVDGLIGQYKQARHRIDKVAEIMAGELGGVVGYFIEGNKSDRDNWSMIPQADLAAYWQAPRRHGFAKPKFDVRINECHPRTGKFQRTHTVYVSAWTHEAAAPAALAWLRELMTGKTLGRLQVVEVTYSQPVNCGEAA